MKKLFVLIAVICLSVLFCFGETPIEYDQIRIVDGDSAELSNNNVKTKVRFLLFDSPELKQDFGVFCKAKLQSFMRVGVTQFFPFGEDLYRRKLVQVYTDEKWINLEMVKAGCGWSYFVGTGSTQTSRDEITKAFEVAKTEKVGAFSGVVYENPRIYRLRKKLK
jgi:endonuclease YncB( thermonuclease family)